MKPIVVANWKMNPLSLAEAKKLFNSVTQGTRKIKGVTVVICPPFIYLSSLGANGSQDCFFEEKGAFTGEVSVKMLKNLGCRYVIVGHSERRQYQKETDEMVNKKLKSVLEEGLKPILCIANLSQLKKSLKGVPKEGFNNLILAYEPVFAIGTGKPCSVDKAKRMRISIKKAAGVPVLYGGSVNGENAKDYIKEGGFNGLLVGGASLKSKEFIEGINNDCE